MDAKHLEEFIALANTKVPRHFIGIASSREDGFVFDVQGDDLLVIHDPIFGFDIVIAHGDVEWCLNTSGLIFPDALRQSRALGKSEVSKDVGGSCYTDDESKLCLIRLAEFRWNILSHEATHAACWVAERIHIQHCAQSEEFFCYYAQWIVQAVEAVHVMRIPRNDQFVKLFPLTTEEAVA